VSIWTIFLRIFLKVAKARILILSSMTCLTISFQFWKAVELTANSLVNYSEILVKATELQNLKVECVQRAVNRKKE